MVEFTGVKVFSTTLARDREVMGETITRWLGAHPGAGDRRPAGDPELRQGVPLPDHHPLLPGQGRGHVTRRWNAAWNALTLGGQVPAAAGGLLAALLLATLGATVFPALRTLLQLDLGDGWRLLQPWRYLTWAFLEAPLPGSLLTLLFAGLMLVWLGRSSPRPGASAACCSAWAPSWPGPACSPCWCSPHSTRTCASTASGRSSTRCCSAGGWSTRSSGSAGSAWWRCAGSRWPGWSAWGTPAWVLLEGLGGAGLQNALAAYLPHLAALLVAWVLVGTGPRRGWRRLTGRWREARLKRARSRFEVIDPGPRPPREWRN